MHNITITATPKYGTTWPELPKNFIRGRTLGLAEVRKVEVSRYKDDIVVIHIYGYLLKKDGSKGPTRKVQLEHPSESPGWLYDIIHDLVQKVMA